MSRPVGCGILYQSIEGDGMSTTELQGVAVAKFG